MSVNVGSAVAYLDLDYSKYSTGLMKAGQLLSIFNNDVLESGMRIEALGGAITAIGSTLVTGLTVPLVAVGASATKVAVDFEAQMSRVKAISGATGEDFEKLQAQAEELGAATSFSATEAAEGMENLASAGFTTNQILAAMPGLLDLAASDNLDLATAADIAASTLNGFGLEASQAAHVADVLAKAAADTNAGITDTGEAMKYIAPVAATMGQSLEEVTAAIGLMSNAGIKGGQSGTTLRTALTRLANPSNEAANLMKDLGFNAYDSSGKMLSLKDIIGNLGTSIKGLTEEQQQQAIATIFGQESMSGMLALISAGPAELERLTKSLENCDGAANEMANTMMDNTKGAWDEFTSALEGAGIVIGNTLLPAITKGINKVTDMVSAFNNLDPAVQKNIVSIGATVAAIGPLMMIGGKVITGIGSTIKLVSSLTSLAGSGLVASLSAVTIPLVAVGAGFYAWHEAMDVANQKVTKSREEMSLMEKLIADFSGKITYSREELEEMGLVWKEFSDDISPEFQEAIKTSAKDLWDFQMRLNEITLDDVITQDEADELVNRFNDACSSAIEAVSARQNEIQSTFMEAFGVDGIIDDNEQVLLGFFENETQANLSHITSMQDEVNELRRRKREEGYEFTDEDNQKIADYYAAVLQAELEANATNQSELLYSQNQFKQQVKTMDADSASELLQQRKEQYEAQKLDNNAYYDTLIQMMQEKMSEMNSTEKEAALEQIELWEQQKLEKNKSIQDMWNQDIQTTIDSNEELLKVINKFNGQILDENDIAVYELLAQASECYKELNNITESGYTRLYNSTTKAWDDVYIKVDEKTGELIGCYDLNSTKLGAMTANDASLLQDEIAAWQQTEEGILVNCLMIGDAYIDASGKIENASGKTIGSLGKVIDENGRLVEAVLTTNGTPINLGDNTNEIITKLKNTQNAVKDTNGMKANINVTDNGTAAQVQRNIDGISSYKQVIVGVQYTSSGKPYYNGSTMYATGTENAMPGIASVAEYGPELIQSRSGELTFATTRQLVNMEGGEIVYNARQTKEILSSMDNRNSEQKISKSDVMEAANLIVSSIKGLDSNIENAIKETGNTTVVGDLGGSIDIDRIDMRELTEEISHYLALHCKSYR